MLEFPPFRMSEPNRTFDMRPSFPHRDYLAAALVLATGGFALTAGIISGESAMIEKLVEAFLMTFTGGMAAVAVLSNRSKHEKD
jgi:hypothetical protein